MSDLKHQNIDELNETREACVKYLKKLKSQVSGQTERLKWIDYYLTLHWRKEMRTQLELDLAEAFMNLEWEDGYAEPPAGLRSILYTPQAEVYAHKLAKEAMRIINKNSLTNH